MQEHRSIEQLENDYWKDVDFPSTLVERCFTYRKIPVSELSVEQLRLLVGQQIGLPYTIPKAITVLKTDIFWLRAIIILAIYLTHFLVFLKTNGINFKPTKRSS